MSRDKESPDPSRSAGTALIDPPPVRTNRPEKKFSVRWKRTLPLDSNCQKIVNKVEAVVSTLPPISVDWFRSDDEEEEERESTSSDVGKSRSRGPVGIGVVFIGRGGGHGRGALRMFVLDVLFEGPPSGIHKEVGHSGDL